MKMVGAALPLILILAEPATATRADHSWGKTGVSRADYDADAVACSLRTASRDVSADRETRDYVRGFDVLDREDNMPPMAQPPDEDSFVARTNRKMLLRRMYKPDRKVAGLQAKLQQEVEACLTARGYVRFTLSRDQSRRLKTLPAGTRERRDFLSGLATGSPPASSPAQ